jgi:CHAD domain-containing protein
MLIDAHARFTHARHATAHGERRADDARLTAIRNCWRILRQTLHSLDNDKGVEVIHDARTQARRLRGLLRALRSELNPTAYEAMRFDLKNIGRELAGARTADEHLRCLRELSGATRHLNTRDMLTMIALCEKRAVAARKLLTAITQETAWAQRIARIERSIGDDDLLLRSCRAAREECREMLACELRAAARRLSKHKSSMGALHRQRIRLKNTRYVCEQLQPLADVDLRTTVKRIDQAQDSIGEARDLQSLSAWLKTTPVPQTLYRPLLERIDRKVRKSVDKFQLRRPKLRIHLRTAARQLRTMNGA